MTRVPTVIDGDDLLRALYELMEEADNSCSEPEDFIRGMRCLFDAAVRHIDATKGNHSAKGDALALVAPMPRLPIGPA